MGPRRVSRGNEESYRFHVYKALLQWGRGVLAAEITVATLQTELSSVASMGPRRVSRGNMHSRYALALSVIASMGPRRVSRGNRKYDRRRDRGILLQWGRGVLAAEIREL